MADPERFELDLPLELAQFVHSQVGQGAMATDSDVLREAVRVMQREAAQLRQLQLCWSDGAASGDAGRLDFAELRIAAQAQLAASKG